MAKLVMAFDSYEGLESFEGKQAIAQFRGTAGVQSVKVYRASEGKPVYQIDLEVEDDKAEALKKRIQSTVAGYAGYVTNFTLKQLKEIAL